MIPSPADALATTAQLIELALGPEATPQLRPGSASLLFWAWAALTLASTILQLIT